MRKIYTIPKIITLNILGALILALYFTAYTGLMDLLGYVIGYWSVLIIIAFPFRMLYKIVVAFKNKLVKPPN